MLKAVETYGNSTFKSNYNYFPQKCWAASRSAKQPLEKHFSYFVKHSTLPYSLSSPLTSFPSGRKWDRKKNKTKLFNQRYYPEENKTTTCLLYLGIRRRKKGKAAHNTPKHLWLPVYSLSRSRGRGQW